MSRRTKIIRNIAIGIAAFLIVGVIAIIQVVQTDWFRAYVRTKIIAATEEATGGKVEIGSFAFDWRHLRAEVTDFVIHGTEPADARPFVQAARVQVDIRLFTGFRHLLNVAYLGVDQPQVNVMVFDNGTTNIPHPAPKQPASDTSPLETVVNLAVGRFELNSGTLRYNAVAQPLDVQAHNLRVQLAYNLLKQGYEGQLSLQPIYVVQGRRTPLEFTLTLPLTLERDKISVQNATLSTAASELKITASLSNLKRPETSVQVNGHIAVAELNTLGNLSLAADPRGEMGTLLLDVDGQVGADRIKVAKLHLALGGSRFDASGTLRDPQGGNTLTFDSNFNLAELARLMKAAPRPTGDVTLDGTARFNADLVELPTFRVRGFGGELTGNASLQDFDRYRVQGNLKEMNLQGVEQRLGLKPLPYDGTISGTLEAQGSVKSASSPGNLAKAALTIAPGRRGIPISGRIDAEYEAATSDVRTRGSSVALPHTRANISGSLRTGLQVDVTSQDLADVFAAIPGAPPPVKLNGGEAHVAATLTGALGDPRITGHLSATRIAIQDRQFDAIATDFAAATSRFAVENGSVSRGTMQARFAGAAGLRDWSPKPEQPLTLAANVSNGDLADILALAGQKSAGYAGALTATVNIAGTIGNPTGSANVQVTAGTLVGEPFDQLQAQVSLADRLVTISSATLRRDASHIDLTADYRHPADSFTTGHLNAHVSSNAVDLSKVGTVQKTQPTLGGVVELDATISGDLIEDQQQQTQFLLASVAGNVSAKGLQYDHENYGDLTANASTSSGTVTYNLTSNFAGSQVRAEGRTQLAPDYPTTLDANLSNLPIERVLLAAKRSDIPAKGKASGTFHLMGTVADPQGSADLEVTDAVLYEEPVDRLRARVSYLPDSITLTELDATAGPSHLGVTAKFDHPRGDLQQGTWQFEIQDSRVELARIRNIRTRRPGLSGAVQISGEGKGQLHAGTANRLAIQDLNAHVGTGALAYEGKNLGSLNLDAKTTAGVVNFTLDSGLAGAAIRGKGSAGLTGSYPVKAELTFDDLKWENLQPLVSGGTTSSFDGATSGRITVDGPAANASQLNASLILSTLQIRPTQSLTGTGAQPLVLQNQGDITINMNGGTVRIQSAHLTGPQTDINATGTASMRDKKLDLRLNATANLQLLRTMSSDLYSSGSVVLATTVNGTFDQPSVNGRIELRDAALNYSDLPAGLEKANGVVLFNGTTATIQTLSADSGGGKISITGFVTRANELRFALRARANGVRVRVQQGVSAVLTANINLTGTTANSSARGNVSIDRITYAPQTDIGSMLTRAGPPVQSPASPQPLLQNMNLDVAVRTSTATSVQASLAQNLQIIADLRVRGRAAQPGMVGTVQLSHGDLVFFGSTYRISSGTVSFFNPNRIEPLLDITLETQAKGVTVVLAVTGPIDDMKLSYTSDPPLQFQEIVTLLAAGKAPTSDPTLLASQPTQPAQSFEQRGESALLGKALADPLSNRLQRVFGVSQLKIDPSFTSGSQLPQARATLQQQISSNVLFTYVTALDDPNTQIIRVEWSLSPTWAAVANRDENGLVSINLLYKKQFR